MEILKPLLHAPVSYGQPGLRRCKKILAVRLELLHVFEPPGRAGRQVGQCGTVCGGGNMSSLDDNLVAIALACSLKVKARKRKIWSKQWLGKRQKYSHVNFRNLELALEKED